MPALAARLRSALPLPTRIEPEAVQLPRGELPIIGDPIRDLTIWYAQRVSDANRAAVENLQGSFLTPVDPLTDEATSDLYGKMLIITIPLLTLGGLILGYLIMVARTSGESAYAVRSVTPRFVVGAVLSICGIFLVSVLAQFVIATDVAMVGVSLRPESVGAAEQWPAGGGVFMVLQRGGFDPRIGEGPANWNSGASLCRDCGSPAADPLRHELADPALDVSDLGRVVLVRGIIDLDTKSISSTWTNESPSVRGMERLSCAPPRAAWPRAARGLPGGPMARRRRYGRTPARGSGCRRRPRRR